MSVDIVSPLRQRMIEDMTARKLGAGTQRLHISSCKRFAAFLQRSPGAATVEDIRRFQLHLAETGTSIPNRNRIMTGLRFLFRVTLRRLDLAAEIYHLREPQKIPQVISPDEARRLGGAARPRSRRNRRRPCPVRRWRLRISPQPRGGVATCQCRPRQPRPVEGDDGHRALPHGGAWWPCGALRGLCAHRHRL